MIRNFGTVWVLDTENTTYAFRILKSGHAEHLYYGASVRIESEEDAYALTEKSVFQPGNLIAYDKDNDSLCLENVRLEMSSYGKGDIREPFIEICDKKAAQLQISCSKTERYFPKSSRLKPCRRLMKRIVRTRRSW